VFDMGNAIVPTYWASEWGPMFAGVRLIAAPMAVAGNVFNTSARGQAFIEQADLNPKSPVATAWAQAMNNVPQTDGGPCSPPAAGDYSLGGGHGIDGCGCVVSMSVGATAATSMEGLQEVWNDFADDLKDKTWAANNYSYQFA